MCVVAENASLACSPRGARIFPTLLCPRRPLFLRLHSRCPRPQSRQSHTAAALLTAQCSLQSSRCVCCHGEPEGWAHRWDRPFLAIVTRIAVLCVKHTRCWSALSAVQSWQPGRSSAVSREHERSESCRSLLPLPPSASRVSAGDRNTVHGKTAVRADESDDTTQQTTALKHRQRRLGSSAHADAVTDRQQIAAL